MRKDQWTIKTLVEEAVNSDSPEATKEKGIQQHTGNTVVAYRFKKGIYKLWHTNGVGHQVEHRELIRAITRLVSPASFSILDLSSKRASRRPAFISRYQAPPQQTALISLASYQPPRSPDP